METTKRKREGQKEKPSLSKNKKGKLDITSPGCPHTLVSPDSAYGSYGPTPSSACPYSYDSEKPSSNNFVFSQGRTISSMEECLKGNYKLLKEELIEKELSAQLYQCGIIDRQEYERILEEKFRSRRCDRLIKAIVSSKKANEAGSFEELLKRLKKTGVSHIAESLDSFVKNGEGDGEYNTMSQSDDIEARNKLRKLVASFEKELEPKTIIDDLLVNGMLSFRDHEDVFEPTERQKRVSVLVDKILRSPARNLNLLCLVLRNEFQPDHVRLAEEIDTCHGTMAESETPEVHLTVKGNMAVAKVIGDVRDFSFVLKFDGRAQGVQSAEKEIVANTQMQPDQEEIAMRYLRSSVQGVDHCCVKIRLQAMSSTSVKLLKQLIEDGHSTEFIQEFIQSFLTPKAIQFLQEAGSRELHVEIRMLHVSDTGKCKKRISKELIVEHFTKLSTELPEIKEMSEAFSSAIAGNGDTNITFGEKEETKEGFLRTLLKLPEKYLCLFEQELWRLDRHDVIANLSVKRSAGTRREINTDVIRQNFSFLLGEIEPRDFLHGLDNAHSGAEQKIDSIINAGTRQEGARRLLKYLLETPDAVQNFVLQAEAKNLTAIVKLFEETTIDDDILRQGIVRNYSKLVQEIDPRRLRTAMVEREVFSKTEFDKITESGSRVCIAGDFLKALLAKDDEGRSLHCFTVALEMNDYENLAKLIVNTPAGNEECQCWKPREKNGSNVFKLVFKLQFKEAQPKETDLQLKLHKLLYRSRAKIMDDADQSNTPLVSQPQESQCSLSGTPSSAPCCTPTTSADNHVTEARGETYECLDSPNLNDVLEVISSDGEIPASSLEDNSWSDYELNNKTHPERLSQYLNDVATVETVTVRENTHGVQLMEPERHSIPAVYGDYCSASSLPTCELPLLQAYTPFEYRSFYQSWFQTPIPQHAMWGNMRSEHRSAISVQQHREALHSEHPSPYLRKSPRT